MKLVAPRDCYLAPVGAQLAKGDVVDVPDDVGASLLEQDSGWKQPAKTKTPPVKPADLKESA